MERGKNIISNQGVKQNPGLNRKTSKCHILYFPDQGRINYIPNIPDKLFSSMLDTPDSLQATYS